MDSTTRNPDAVIDDDAFSVRRTIRIAAPIDKVWQAISVPEHVSRWFGTTVLVGSGTGATGTVTFPGEAPFPLRIEAFDEPRLIAYRWRNDDAYRDANGGSLGDHDDPLAPEETTVFTFTLEQVDGGTQLTVVETGFDGTVDAAVNMASHREGWTVELDKLVVQLESAA